MGHHQEIKEIGIRNSDPRREKEKVVEIEGKKGQPGVGLRLHYCSSKNFTFHFLVIIVNKREKIVL